MNARLRKATGAGDLGLRSEPTWVAGRSGAPGDHALSLNGRDEWLEVPARDYADWPTRSITAWVRLRGETSGDAVDAVIVGFDTPPWTARCGLLLRARAQPAAILAELELQSALRLPVDDWVHVAVTYGEEIRLYVNGVERATAARPPSVPSESGAIAKAPLFIGAGVDAGGRPTSFLPGAVDEVALFSVELTADQVRLLARRP